LGAALLRQIDAWGLTQTVRLEGECPAEEVAARMREADLVAVPSRWEGCPYAVLEAFRVGVPVVATAVGGVPDLIRDGENGVLVPEGDAAALAAAILELLRDPARRRRFAESGRRVVTSLTVEAMADAVGEVYRRAAMRR
jgi:glycosyltransferase involved in cell wall biosynthesis